MKKVRVLELQKICEKYEIIKYNFQILLHPVVKKVIVAYFLKSGRKHMHQITPYKFSVSKGNAVFGLSWFSPSCGECCRGFCNVKKPAV